MCGVRPFKWTIAHCPTCPTGRAAAEITIFIIWLHDKEEPIDKELQIKESSDSMDQNPRIIKMEEKN